MKTNAAYLAQRFAPLKGYKFDGIEEGGTPADVWLRFKRGAVTVCVSVLRDEEGNGPGWVQVETVEGPRAAVDALTTELELVR